MAKKFKKTDIAAVLFLIGLAASFYIFNISQVKAGHTVEFIADVELDLTGLDTTTYVASGSKADSLTISGTDLNVYGIWDGIAFQLKTAAHKVLYLTPSGGMADLTFSSSYVSSGYVSQWTENSSVSVTHIVGVPHANSLYEVKVDGSIYGTYNSGDSAEVSFTRTGGGSSEVFTIKEYVGPGQTHNVYGWAWAGVPQAVPPEKLGLGWISFNSTNCDSDGDGITDTGNYSQCPVGQSISNYGVNIESDGNLTGYAYFEMGSGAVGWIHFDPPGPYPNCPVTTCPAGSPNYSARVNLSTKKVTGWARALNYDGGWDGWILLGPIVKDGTDYGVYIDISTSPAQFKGWAWGSEVMGWISFNCANQGVCTQATAEGGPSDYKVMTSFSFIFNQPPDQPQPVGEGETWNHCGIRALSIPTFHWTYSDHEGDPQAASQIKIYGETTLDEEISCPPTCTDYTPPNEYIRNNLHWGETYNWQVRVKDDQENWSDWSDLDSFTMPAHAYPWPDFSHSPQNPSVGEIVNFTDLSECYSSPGNTEYDCKDGGATTIGYEWDFDYSEPEGFTVDSYQKGDATTTYGQVKNYQVRLRITDNTLSPPGICIGSGDSPVSLTLPLPEWREIPPF